MFITEYQNRDHHEPTAHTEQTGEKTDNASHSNENQKFNDYQIYYSSFSD